MTIRQRLVTFIFAGSLLCVGTLGVDSVSAGAAPSTSQSVAATLDHVATTAAAALEAMGTASFTVRLQHVASAVATRLEVDGKLLNQAWVAVDQSHQVALLSALTQVGVPYHRNSSNAGVAFDCSGLTSYAWGQAGIAIAHQSGRQIRNAAARTLETAQAGDLAYYPGHVMMWLGVDDLIVHAVGSGRSVEVGDISNRRVSRAKFGDPTG